MGTVLDILIVTGIAVLAIWAVVSLRKNKGRCGGCTGCPMAGKCDKQEAKKKHE